MDPAQLIRTQLAARVARTQRTYSYANGLPKSSWLRGLPEPSTNGVFVSKDGIDQLEKEHAVSG